MIKRQLIASAAGTILLATSCSNDIAEVRALGNDKNLPVQTMKNAVYTFTQAGNLRNRLSAAVLEQYIHEEGNTIEVHQGMQMLFYDSLARLSATLEARNGRYTERDKRMMAWDQVSLTNVEGQRLETEELWFSLDSGRIYTHKYVKITTRDGVIHGTGLESNDSFTRYRILQPSGEFLVDETPENSK